MESTPYSSRTLDHLGPSTGMCRGIGISEVIDPLGEQRVDQIVREDKPVNILRGEAIGIIIPEVRSGL